MNAYIQSFALITQEHFITPAGIVPHPGDSLSDIPRESVFPEMYRPFGKMGTTEKLIFSAVSLAISGISLPESTGIILQVPSGSLETDCAYMRSVRENFPSPSLFAATLPSSSIAELAIPFKLHGPNRVIAGTDQASTIINALFLINRGTPFVIVGYANPDNFNGYASALILSKEPTQNRLCFSTQKDDYLVTSDLFKRIIADIRGKNDISHITTDGGTFYVKENIHGITDRITQN